MWTDPSASPLPATVLKTSVKWSEGYKLKNWARRVNVENGTPIRSELMASHFNESLATNELNGFGKEVHSASASIKRWCHRWRLRHGAKYGFLRTSEHIALEDKREQALTGVSTSPPSPPMPLLFLSTPASCCTLPVAPTTSTRSSVRSSNSGGFGPQKGQIWKVLDPSSPPLPGFVLPPKNDPKNGFKITGPKWTEAPEQIGLPVRFFRKKKLVQLVPFFGT